MRIPVLVTYLLISKAVYGQPPPPSSKAEKLDFTKYNVTQRNSFYPFDKAKQIKLVSFGQQFDSSYDKPRAKFGLPVSKDQVALEKLDQSIELTPGQVDSLTDIIYNSCARWTIVEATSMACWYPRNAILFFDETGNAFEYIEICFECQGIRYSSKQMAAAFVCDPMYDDLQSFFKWHGLKTSAAELLRKK